MTAFHSILPEIAQREVRSFQLESPRSAPLSSYSTSGKPVRGGTSHASGSLMGSLPLAKEAGLVENRLTRDVEEE